MTRDFDKKMSGQERLVSQVKDFAELEGRQPRAMISGQVPVGQIEDVNKLGVVLADLGFDVDLGPYFNTADELVKNALENDVDLLIVTELDASKRIATLDRIRHLLDEMQRADMLLLIAVSTAKVEKSNDVVLTGNIATFSNNEIFGVLSEYLKEYLL